MEEASQLLCTNFCWDEKEKNPETNIILKEKSEVDTNEAYLHSSSKNFKDLGRDVDNWSSSGKDKNNDQDHWEADVAPGFKK